MDLAKPSVPYRQSFTEDGGDVEGGVEWKKYLGMAQDLDFSTAGGC